MSGSIDNSRYLAMIKNRPPISVIPSANKRILTQRVGSNWLAMSLFGGILGIFAYRYLQETFSAELYNTRKQFNIKADPYSGTVSCAHRDAQYTQTGIWLFEE